jgi:hypothetical protein
MRRPILVYNHFDVQPPAPLELWESDPFELDVRGEWAYGRGVADDKGQLWLVLKAAQRLVEAARCPSTSASRSTARRRSAATRSPTTSHRTSAAPTPA